MTDDYKPYPGSEDAAEGADGTDQTAESAEQAQERSIERAERMTAKEIGDLAIKFATDTAYAAAGFADLVGEKAREFTEKQRASMAESGETPADQTKAFLEQVSAQMNKVVEDMGHAYRDLAERGRDALVKLQQQQQAARPEPKDAPGMFDISDDAETADPHTTVEDPTQPEPGAEPEAEPEPKDPEAKQPGESES